MFVVCAFHDHWITNEPLCALRDFISSKHILSLREITQPSRRHISKTNLSGHTLHDLLYLYFAMNHAPDSLRSNVFRPIHFKGQVNPAPTRPSYRTKSFECCGLFCYSEAFVAFLSRWKQMVNYGHCFIGHSQSLRLSTLNWLFTCYSAAKLPTSRRIYTSCT